MADFSANWSASDRPVFPYNSGTKARIEAPQAPEDEQGKGYIMVKITQFFVFKPEGRFSPAVPHLSRNNESHQVEQFFTGFFQLPVSSALLLYMTFLPSSQ